MLNKPAKEGIMFGIDMKAARAVWTAAVVAGLIYGAYVIRHTLMVLVFAVFFSYLVYPLVEFTERRLGPRVRREVIISVIFAMVIGVIVMAATLFGSRVAEEAAGLAKELPQLIDGPSLVRKIPLPAIFEPFRERLLAFARDIMDLGSGQALPAAQQIGSSVVHVTANLIYVAVVPILSFLLVRQAPAIKAQMLIWVGRSSSQFWADIAEEMNYLLSQYVRALLLLSLAALVVYSLVLSLLGVPFPIVLAGAAAVLEVIPVFGPLIGAIAILAIAAFSGYEHIWWLLAFVVAYRIFQDYVLNPYLMSEGVEVSPVLVVIGLLAGDELAGVAGIFLSVPVLAAAKIVIHRVRQGARTEAVAAHGSGSKSG